MTCNEERCNSGRGGTGSDAAGRLGTLLGRMQGFRLAELQTREDRISFWCNLYNLLVQHGLLVLDVSVSVQEVPRFYRRVGCRIGGEIFTADIILNGILRGNRAAPGRLIPPLPAGDPRLSHSIRPSDSRVLFAACTGTATSPPVTVLRPETMDADLDRAVRRFISKNGNIDLEGKVLKLPRIFKWHADFGMNAHDIAVFVAGFLDEAAARPIREHPESFRLEYEEYDWRVPGSHHIRREA